MCGHDEQAHVLCIGQCGQCKCEAFELDVFDTFMLDYQKCSASSSFPKLADLAAFEPQGKQKQRKGQD